MRRVLGPLVVVSSAVFVASAGAAVPAKPLPPASTWEIPATTIQALNLGLVQQPTAQEMPSSVPECAPFAAAFTQAAPVTSSLAFQVWRGPRTILQDSVRVFKTKNAALQYWKPEKNMASSKACITAYFTPTTGSTSRPSNPSSSNGASTLPSAQVTVEPQNPKLHDADAASSWIVHVTYNVPNQPPQQIGAQTLDVRYETGVIETLLVAPTDQFAAAAAGVRGAIKKDLATID